MGKRYIEMPEELAKEAEALYSVGQALDDHLAKLTGARAAYIVQAMKLGAKLEKKRIELGIEKTPEEMLSYDFETDRFFISVKGGL